MPRQQVAFEMIRAQMTLADGVTPGAMRYGTIQIDACIARGCRIVPNPLNSIPPEYKKYLVKAPKKNASSKVQ
jgi:hypothetical protein